MADEFETHSAGLNGPASGGVEIDLSGGDATCQCGRAVYVGVAGDVKVQMKDGSVITFRNVAAGCERPWRVKKIFKLGTTADGIVVLW
jgi:hypothetical protein